MALPQNTAARFEPTNWSLVLAAIGKSSAEGAKALESLCSVYWYPLYAFARQNGLQPHDAQDATQGFLEHLLEDGALRTVCSDKGRFRSFLKTAMTNFLHNERQRQQARKRGGRQVVSWEDLNAEKRYRREPADHETPDRLFERRWAAAIIERVKTSLRQEYAALGKETLYERLKPFLTEEPGPGVYTSLSATLLTTEGALKVSLHRLRRRFGQLVRQQIALTVADPSEIESEIRHLFAAWDP